MRRIFFLVLTFCIACPAFAKKDFKGLFGSYRREKYTENEGRDDDLGVDFLLSTMLPISPMVESIDTNRTNAPSPLYYSTFFNVEASVFYTLNYNWELFANVGYYTYDTRKENALTQQNPAQQPTPIFHQFSLTAYPVILGVKYRLSRSDIVPYIGIGAGAAFCTRKGSYDNDPSGKETDSISNTAIAAQGTVGFEFFFDARAGIRLEMSAMYIGLPQRTYDYTGGQGSIALTPILIYESNPWAVRYASGIFYLF